MDIYDHLWCLKCEFVIVMLYKTCLPVNVVDITQMSGDSRCKMDMICIRTGEKERRRKGKKKEEKIKRELEKSKV